MKVFELKIDEEDDMSGIQYISIVKDPATQISWEIFNNQEEVSCSHKEDLTEEALALIDNYGMEVSDEAFFNAEIKYIDELVIENFAVPSINPDPRKESIFDDNSNTASVITRYIYTIDTGVGAPLMKTSRQLCRKMLLAQRVWSKDDMAAFSLQLSSQGDTFKLVPRAKTAPNVDFFQYKSGNRCRHRWQQIDFPIGIDETYETALSKIPVKAQAALGKGENVGGSGRPFISEARYLNRMPTNMSAQDEMKPIGFHFGLFVYPTRFAALVAEPTAKIISKVKLGILEGYCPVDIMDDYYEGTGEVLEKFKVREAFAVPTQEIQDTAQSVLNWVEDNGWGSCGTEVGKIRANQLAKGDNISLETITRMFSYLSRHKVDLDASTSYEDGCGKLMYDSWGGEAALGWAEREMKKATEMNVMFSADDFKGDITAVVFQPNQKIYRWDRETNSPYYVFMSRDTIRKMLMKLSRLKPKNLINYEHSGMVFDGDDVYTYENWLVGDNPKIDKSYEMFGREFEPGTWLTTIHFADRRIFDDFVLSQKTSSVSLEGMFEEVPFNFFDAAEVGERGGIKESKKAPNSDTPNKDPKGEGTAKGDAGDTRSAEVPKSVEEILQKKSDDFNERYKEKLGYGSTLGMLKSVYQRGVGAYNTSHSPEVKSSQQWALARVNAFLYIIKNGRPENPKYTGDYDLLPGKHPKKEEMTKEDFITEYIPYDDIAEQYCNCDYGYTAIGFKIGDIEEYKCVEENSEEAMDYNAAQLVMKLEALLKEMDKSIS